jgi:gluconolactonase
MNYETTIEAEQIAADRAAYEAGEATPVRGKRTVIVAVVLVIAAIAAAWFLMRGGATAPAANPDAQAPSVTVVTPGRVTIDGTITASGTLAARRLMPVGVAGEGGQVVSVLVDAGPGGSPDGFRVDVDGNLWCGWGMGSADLDGVRIFNSAGKPIGHIDLPERCANLCFGGRHRNRLFMAASHSLYALYVNTQGAIGG